jgi:hypothetical protein
VTKKVVGVFVRFRAPSCKTVVEFSSLDLFLQETGSGTVTLPVARDLVRLQASSIVRGPVKINIEVLAALCTLHLTYTDEASGKEIFRLAKSMTSLKARQSSILNGLDSIKIDTRAERLKNLMSVEAGGRMSAGHQNWKSHTVE